MNISSTDSLNIKHIQQPSDNTCVSACIAMITGMPVDQVIHEFHKDYYEKQTLSIQEYIEYINNTFADYVNTGKRIQLIPAYSHDPIEYGKLYLVSVPSLCTKGVMHQIVVDTRDGNADNPVINVYDPQKGNGVGYYVSAEEYEAINNGTLPDSEEVDCKEQVDAIINALPFTMGFVVDYEIRYTNKDRIDYKAIREALKNVVQDESDVPIGRIVNKAQELPRLMVIGQARHGKDTFCEIAQSRGYTFTSSSWECAETVVYPVLAEKYGYTSVQECFDDRHNHRSEWFELIRDYNTPDLAKLGRQIYSKSNIYCGIRNKPEFLALRDEGAFDISIWVDASERVAPEDSASISMRPSIADVLVFNNGTLEEFEADINEMLHKIETWWAIQQLIGNR